MAKIDIEQFVVLRFSIQEIKEILNHTVEAEAVFVAELKRELRKLVEGEPKPAPEPEQVLGPDGIPF